MKALQTGCPHPLELIHAKNGTLEDEKKLHEKVKQYRTSGEWFSWNESVSKIIGVPLNAKAINPDSPGFLTPRQKQINYYFRRRRGEILSPCPLSLFLSRTIYTEKDILDFPEIKAAFFLAQTTGDFLVGQLGHVELCKDKSSAETQLFIIPKYVVKLTNLVEDQSGDKLLH